MTRDLSPFSNATTPGRVRRRAAPRPLTLLPADAGRADAAPAPRGPGAAASGRAEAAVAAAALLRDLDALVEAGLIVPELVDGEVRYSPAPEAPDLDDAA
jgi:hypothetical protein